MSIKTCLCTSFYPLLPAEMLNKKMKHKIEFTYVNGWQEFFKNRHLSLFCVIFTVATRLTIDRNFEHVTKSAHFCHILGSKNSVWYGRENGVQKVTFVSQN